MMNTGRSRADEVAAMRAIRAKEKAFEVALSKQPVPGLYQKFVPEIGTLLVISFPGESIRCPVKKIISPDSALIHLDSVPMAKSHTFEFDKTYGVRRRVQDGRDVWEAQKDAEFLTEQARILSAEQPALKPRKRLPPETLKPAPKKEKK